MDDSGIRRSIVRNTAWNYVGFAVNLAVNLLLFPAAVSQMGDAATGVWLLIGSVSGYMGLLQLGLAPAMGQFAAAHMATRDDLALGRTVSTALVLVVGLGSLALLGLPAVPWLLDAFSIPEAIRADASIAFVLGIVGVPLQMPGHVFNAVLGASQRQDRCTQVWMVSLIGKLVGIALLLTLGYGLEAIMWLETGLILVTGLLLTVFAIRSAPQLRLSPSLVSVDTARELLGLGGWTFLNSVSSSLIEQTDRIVVGLFLAVDAITHYSAAWKLYMLVYSVTTTMVQALWPVAAGLHARRDAHGLRQLWLRMTKYNVAVTWPLAASLGFSAGPILRVWLGPSFADNYGVVMVLVASFVVTAHNHTAFALLGGMRRIAPVVRRYSIPQAILNLLLSLWLVHPLGMLGVALGTLLPVLLLQYTFMAFILKELDLGWREVWSAVVRPTALPALVAFTPCLAVWVWLGPQSFWLVPTAAAGSALYAAIFWSGMHPKERADLLSHVPGPLRAVLAA